MNIPAVAESLQIIAMRKEKGEQNIICKLGEGRQLKEK